MKKLKCATIIFVLLGCILGTHALVDEVSSDYELRLQASRDSDEVIHLTERQIQCITKSGNEANYYNCPWVSSRELIH